jgi:hydroxymethylbilane synthase
MATDTIRIGSRGSELALWQAHWVQDHLARLFPASAIAIDIIKTKGDKILDAPLARIGDKGLFTREIECAAGRLHRPGRAQPRDLPTTLPEDSCWALSQNARTCAMFHPKPGNPALVDRATAGRIATGACDENASSCTSDRISKLWTFAAT